MKEENWIKFGEIQYLRGRLDELFKLNKSLLELDMKSLRIVDARITKYLGKLKKVDAMAYHLYHIERENIKYSLKKVEK